MARDQCKRLFKRYPFLFIYYCADKRKYFWERNRKIYSKFQNTGTNWRSQRASIETISHSSSRILIRASVTQILSSWLFFFEKKEKIIAVFVYLQVIGVLLESPGENFATRLREDRSNEHGVSRTAGTSALPNRCFSFHALHYLN